MNGNRVTIFLTALAILIIVFMVTRAVTASQLESVLSGSGAPTMVSYQGQVKVGGTPYSGTGYFKFAIWSGSGGNAWTNDGTAAGGGEPTDSVPLMVSDGLFNVLLGDTSLPNMNALPASVFDETKRYLRIWFSSDDTTFTLLSPDQRIAAVPYALQAEKTLGYANVVVVAKSGGDYKYISDALASITTASDSNRYLVKVMPGVYDEQVSMKQYVDIEGSGELITKITQPGSSIMEATLLGADDAELRWLTVENTGGNDYAVAINNNNVSPLLKQVTAIASDGDYNYGILNQSSESVMSDVSIIVSGGKTSYAIYNKNSQPTMRDVNASVTDGDDNSGI